MAAIYQWFEGAEVVVTTTLYPIEHTQALEFSIDLQGTVTRGIEEDRIDFGMTFVDMDVIEVLIALPQEEDFIDFGMTFIDMDVILILFDLPVEEDVMDFGMTFIDMDVTPNLIIVYSPNESLQLSIDLDPSGCSLDPV